MPCAVLCLILTIPLAMASDRLIVFGGLQYAGNAFANLEPGEYRFASQTAVASVLPALTLEAGKTYYFLQVCTSSGGNVLSQHSGEVVMHELSGVGYSRWERIP